MDMRDSTFAFLLTLFLAGTLTLSYVLAFGSGTTCTVADPVRLQLNGIEYRIPAALQPLYSPEAALPTRDYFPNNFRTRQYCQSRESPTAVVDWIHFPRKNLIAWAGEDAGRAELAGIYPLSITRSARSDFSVPEGGQSTPDGPFRRIVRGEKFEIISNEPMFFGTIISASCGPAATQQPSNSCRIWGRLRNGSLVSIGVHDTQKPINGWPRMLRQVEAFSRRSFGHRRCLLCEDTADLAVLNDARFTSRD
ncbi:hypothetical protein AB7M45_001799 [Bradyrhizobium elkanii]|nr:hypothetical protein [Bradyrhizobium elkanii]MCP1754109.1 hypothetical protein [Bradyrhizobium elkanii]MCP1979629.1 hypothetical protein [Bradyrhizobium elkanii]